MAKPAGRRWVRDFPHFELKRHRGLSEYAHRRLIGPPADSDIADAR